MFDDTAKESCAIWMAELESHTMKVESGGQGSASTDHERADRVTTEQRNDYEPADKVPFPNSSSMISERSVQFLRANETWLRSIMKADCSCGE